MPQCLACFSVDCTVCELFDVLVSSLLGIFSDSSFAGEHSLFLFISIFRDTLFVLFCRFELTPAALCKTTIFSRFFDGVLVSFILARNATVSEPVTKVKAK